MGDYCEHCGLVIVEAWYGLWVHLTPADRARPDVCGIGDDYSATPQRKEG